MKMTESLENYLETILILSQKKTQVRSIDVAEELNFKKPSVSVAMKNLREHDYVTFSPEGFITLTAKGREVADAIYERHQLFSSLLQDLGVPAEIALHDACRIEHVISPESFQAIKTCLPKHKGL